MISIVMATYNGSKYIYDQLLSLNNQTVKPDEIVICDDKSTDNTIEIIEKFFDSFKIKHQLISHQENKGVMTSFYDGISAANGEIIFLCDQDDVWVKTKIEVMQQVFTEKQNVVLVFCNATIVDSELHKYSYRIWDTVHFSPDTIKNSNDYFSEMVKRNIFTGMCMAFRKGIIKGIDSFPKEMYHDEYLGWLALKTGDIYAIDSELVLYRQHSQNVVGVLNKHKLSNVSNTKNMIVGTTKRIYKKFLVLCNMDFNKNQQKTLENACKFYKWRSSINVIKKSTGFMLLYKNIVNGNYNKYTLPSEHAIIKDIFCLLL